MKLRGEALTFDDVLLLPAKSTVLPREVDLKTRLTRDISLRIPLLAAAMDTITESRLAIALAQEGGVGIIHRNNSIEAQRKEVRRVKRFESGLIKDPLTVSPTTSLGELLELRQRYNISGMPVVDGNKLVGIITNRDVRFETDKTIPVSRVMTQGSQLVTVREGTDRREIVEKLQKNRIEKMLVVDEHFHLRGMITVTDMLKAREKPRACKDERGQLRVGAAVGVCEMSRERAETLVKEGVDLLIVDTAHAHGKGVVEQIRWIKKRFPKTPLIGGNIATQEAALALYEAGVDGVKVGIGPGSICTTRIVSGVGVPQVTAIDNVARALKGKSIPIIADGGIRYSGDITKALAAGAHSVMIGSLFAGTEEAPGEVELYKGRSYKTYRGMGSLGAMKEGSRDRYFQHPEDEASKLVPEGIEGRVPYAGSLVSVVHQLLGGLMAGMGYTGCDTIEKLHTEATFITLTNMSVREGHVHDVTITKEAPNYRVE